MRQTVVFYELRVPSPNPPGPDNTTEGLTYSKTTLVNENNEPVGFMLTNRIQDKKNPPPPGFDYNPYIVTKSINTPKGIITYIYETVNELPVVVRPVYEAGFKNSVVTRIYTPNTDLVRTSQIIVEYDE